MSEKIFRISQTAECQAFDFIEKPLSLEKTILTVRNAVKQRELEKVNQNLSEQIKQEYEMVGEIYRLR